MSCLVSDKEWRFIFSILLTEMENLMNLHWLKKWIKMLVKILRAYIALFRVMGIIHVMANPLSSFFPGERECVHTYI